MLTTCSLAACTHGRSGEELLRLLVYKEVQSNGVKKEITWWLSNAPQTMADSVFIDVSLLCLFITFGESGTTEG